MLVICSIENFTEVVPFMVKENGMMQLPMENTVTILTLLLIEKISR